jgi:hypothetical protein
MTAALLAARRVEPEWLDALAPSDPRALRSRRDLARLNALMSNAPIVAGELLGALPGSRCSIAEIGAGDGRFALRVARALAAKGRRGTFTLLDRQPCVSPGMHLRFAALGWDMGEERRDAFDWLADPATPRFDALVANLFVHHFEATRAIELLRLASLKAGAFVACEPRRSAVALLGSRMLAVVGCNDVTRHDAVASVRAGFRGSELTSLWPRSGRWRVSEGPRALFSHCFVARHEDAH